MFIYIRFVLFHVTCFFFFPRQIGEAIQIVCNYAAEKMYDHHEWLLAVPLMHFLTCQSSPFKEVLLMDKPKGEEWWGAEGLGTKAVRRKALTGKR